MALVDLFGTITISVKRREREPLNVVLDRIAFAAASAGFADYVISGSFSYKEDEAKLMVAATSGCGHSLEDCSSKISKRFERSFQGYEHTVSFSTPEAAKKL